MPGANPGVRTLPRIHVSDLISTKLEGSSYQVSLSTLIGNGKVMRTMAKSAKETIIEASENGTLAGLLEKHRIKNLSIFRLSENPYSGLRRWAILDMQYDRLNAVYEDLGLEELKYYMRNYRHSDRKGTHNFSTGCGYGIFDADLLGGDADGRVLAAFKHAGLVID